MKEFLLKKKSQYHSLHHKSYIDSPWMSSVFLKYLVCIVVSCLVCILAAVLYYCSCFVCIVVAVSCVLL